MIEDFILITANATSIVWVVPYTVEELLEMGFIPIDTADSTETLFRKP